MQLRVSSLYIRGQLINESGICVKETLNIDED